LWVIFLLVLLTSTLYWTLRSEEQSGDSLTYAYAIETGEDLFHPHHIIFSPVVRVLVLFARCIDPSADAISIAQIHNISWACLAIVSLYLALRILLASRIIPMFAALMLVASNGLFVYSTQAEVYVPATGCLSLVLLMLVTGYKHGWTTTRLLFLSVFFALSVLYHQSNLIFVLPLILALLVGGMRQKVRNIASILCLSSVIIVPAYILAYTSTGALLTLGDFMRFCLAYVDFPNPSWGTMRHFNVAGVALLLKSQLRNIVYLPAGRSAPVLCAVTLFALFLGGLVIYGIRQVFLTLKYRELRMFLIIWLITYYVFFLWWLPGEDEFFVTTLIPLFMLTSLTVQDLSGYATRLSVKKVYSMLAIVAAVAVVAVNLTCSILPRSFSEGATFEEASRITELVDKSCTIVAEYSVLQHLRYYFGREELIEAELMLLYAYQSGVIPDTFQLGGDKRILIPLRVVVPSYSGAGTDGHRDRLGWLTFFIWLFDIQELYSPAMTSRRFETVRDSTGTIYILLSARKVEVANLKQLFQDLDRSIEILTGRKSTIFVSWFEEANS